MLTMAATNRIHAGRIGAVVGRNVGALRSGPAYWLVLLSGFFEPLLYLLSIGVGVGALVGTIPTAHHGEIPYATFVAPAMLTVSAMSGALSETTFNFFFKLRYAKTLEAVLATPVRPIEAALGELIWAVIRGTVYTLAFLLVMVAFGLTTPAGALLALPITLLVSFAFGAIGMVASTFMRGWQDFDLLTAAQFSLFLFSGTFAPVDTYPTALQWLVYATPLYHSVELVRAATMLTPTPGLALHALYLVAMLAISMKIAAHRMEKILLK